MRMATANLGAANGIVNMDDGEFSRWVDLLERRTGYYALKIGLEIYQFEADLSGERFAKRVRADFRGGVRSGVNGTPTFFVNGLRYNGEHTYEAMLVALENAAKPK